MNLVFLIEQNIFASGILQNFLVFSPAKENIKYFGGTPRIDWWKSNGMSSVRVRKENFSKQ